jgi:hypothetical protein
MKRLGKAPVPSCEAVYSEFSIPCPYKTLEVREKYFLCAGHCVMADLGQTIEIRAHGIRNVINL